MFYFFQAGVFGGLGVSARGWVYIWTRFVIFLSVLVCLPSCVFGNSCLLLSVLFYYMLVFEEGGGRRGWAGYGRVGGGGSGWLHRKLLRSLPPRLHVDLWKQLPPSVWSF